MSHLSDLEQQDLLLRNVISQMKQFTEPALSNICGAKSCDSAELVGSATIVELAGSPYLLTAEHVAFPKDRIGNPIEYSHGLFHFVGDGMTMLQIATPWNAAPAPLDIAVILRRPNRLDAEDVTSLSPTTFSRSTSDLDDDLYFLQGWPQQTSRFVSIEDPGVVSKLLPYGGYLTSETTWDLFNSDMHVAITYPMREYIDLSREPATVDECGRPKRLPHPEGLSGSLLWKTNVRRAGAAWEPKLATVVGLVHRFDQDGQCLIATRIEFVREFLLTTLRKEHAYYRWHDRGRPTRDDLVDWLDAEIRIKGL